MEKLYLSGNKVINEFDICLVEHAQKLSPLKVDYLETFFPDTYYIDKGRNFGLKENLADLAEIRQRWFGYLA